MYMTVSFGGVASLFLGCSLVSIVEIIYIIYKTLMTLRQKYCGSNGKYDSDTSDGETPQYSFTF